MLNHQDSNMINLKLAVCVSHRWKSDRGLVGLIPHTKVLNAGVIVPRPGPCNYKVPKYLTINVKCIFKK